MSRIFLLLNLMIALCISSATVAQAQNPTSQSHGSTAVLPPTRSEHHVFIVMEENHGYSDVIGNPPCPT